MGYARTYTYVCTYDCDDRVRPLPLLPLFGGGVCVTAATSSAAPSPPTTSNMAASIRERQTGPSNAYFSHLWSFSSAHGGLTRLLNVRLQC